jgi:hypothetical protein
MLCCTFLHPRVHRGGDHAHRAWCSAPAALVAYKQPVFVYIPPGCELRGGAWAVIDPTINPEYMEMFADPSARGGVLEPSGTGQFRHLSVDTCGAVNSIAPRSSPPPPPHPSCLCFSVSPLDS